MKVFFGIVAITVVQFLFWLTDITPAWIEAVFTIGFFVTVLVAVYKVLAKVVR